MAHGETWGDRGCSVLNGRHYRLGQRRCIAVRQAAVLQLARILDIKVFRAGGRHRLQCRTLALSVLLNRDTVRAAIQDMLHSSERSPFSFAASAQMHACMKVLRQAGKAADPKLSTGDHAPPVAPRGALC